MASGSGFVIDTCKKLPMPIPKKTKRRQSGQKEKLVEAEHPPGKSGK